MQKDSNLLCYESQVTENKTKDPDTRIYTHAHVYVKGQIRQRFQGY